MKDLSFASEFLQRLSRPVCPPPSRCPYCPLYGLRHWIRWGCYKRYAGDPNDCSKRLDIIRYQCAISKRTFSLLPDVLLPYCGIRTGVILQWLYAFFVTGVDVNTLARQANVARGTLRSLKARFLLALPKLRLPVADGALPASAFIKTLADMTSGAVVDLLRDWKEREPKLSVVGIYIR